MSSPTGGASSRVKRRRTIPATVGCTADGVDLISGLGNDAYALLVASFASYLEQLPHATDTACIHF